MGTQNYALCIYSHKVKQHMILGAIENDVTLDLKVIKYQRISSLAPPLIYIAHFP